MKMMKLWMLVVVATIASACSKQDDAGFEGAATKTVQFIATDAAGRTIFGEPEEGVYPVLWEADDQIKVNLNLDIKESGSGRVVLGGGSPTVTPCNGGAEATFGLTLTGENDAAYEDEAEYTFYAISPTSKWSHSNDKEAKLFRLEIPAEQAMPDGGGSCAPQAQLLYGKSDTYAEVPELVALRFKHVAAYGCLTLKNVPGTVKSVTLSADALISYRFFYNIDNAEITFSATDQKEDTITSKGSKTVTVTNVVDNEVWFSMIPTDLSASGLTVEVTMEDDETLVKKVNFKEGHGNFRAGRVAKFSVDFAVLDEPFKVGDIYYENGKAVGVVFAISDGGLKAQVVSLKRFGPTAWSTGEAARLGDRDYGSKTTGAQFTESIRETDAAKNGELPILNFCDELGDGWYWPGLVELKALMTEYHGKTDYTQTTKAVPSSLPADERNAQIAWEKIFADNGGDPLNSQDPSASGDSYWCVQQNSAGTNGYYVRFGKPCSDNNAHAVKSGERYGRAVKDITK